MDLALLALAGVVSGILNSIAGGGSFISFPALMWAGLPPVVANATNTFAVSAGYVSGAIGFKDTLKQSSENSKTYIALSTLGGIIGAFLLVYVPADVFESLIPWLLLIATLLFAFPKQLTLCFDRIFGSKNNEPGRPKLFSIWGKLGLVIVSAYGGYFNAGLGVIVLGYLAIIGHQHIHIMNGIKLLVSSAVALIAVVIFATMGYIDWVKGGVVLIGALIGGFIAAKYSQKLSLNLVRNFVLTSSVLLTGYFFYDVYA